MNKFFPGFMTGVVTGVLIMVFFMRILQPVESNTLITQSAESEEQISDSLIIVPVVQKSIPQNKPASPIEKKEQLPVVVPRLSQVSPIRVIPDPNVHTRYISSRVFYFKYAVSRVDVYAPCPADSIRNKLTVDYAAWFKERQKAQKKTFLGITQRDYMVGFTVFGMTALAFTLARGK